MNLNQLELDFFNALRHGDLVACQKLLNEYSSAAELIEPRAQHLQMKLYLLQNDFENAEKVLIQLQTVEDYKDSLDRLLDTAHLYFYQAKIPLWKKTVDQLKKNTALQMLNVSIQNATVLLGIAKHLEEAGYLVEAERIYQTLQAVYSEANDTRSFKVIANNLRFYVQWRLKKNVSELYQNLIIISKDSLPVQHYIEVQHSLILAELDLFGFDKAMGRYHTLKNEDLLNAYDLKLIHGDILEAVLFQIDQLTPDWQKQLEFFFFPESDLKQDPYLVQLQSIVKAQSAVDYDMNYLQQSLTPSCYLKLSLLLIRFQKISDTFNWIKQYNFLIQQFATATRLIWTQLLNSSVKYFSLNSESPTIQIDHEAKLVFFDDKKLSLEQYPILFYLLTAFVDTKKVSLQDVCRMGWKTDYSHVFFDRIRININRLNKTLSEEFGLPKAFQIRKNDVESFIEVKCSQPLPSRLKTL